MAVSSILKKWYLKNKRNLPWRETRNPYYIWLSEIIMQQTRVEQGLPYYSRFVKKYPTIQKLASAPKDEIMKLWQGLGYYNRAGNMIRTAEIITKLYQGKFPQTHDELLTLKGIGPYTAAAVASFAYDEAVPVLDGNVYRVLSRIYAIDEPMDTLPGKKIFRALAEEVLDKKNPAIHNQAMMELGAMVCKPRKPLCNECPLMLECMAFRKAEPEQFPVRSKKKRPRDRFLSYFFMTSNNYTYIRKRTESDIWKNLYEPPYIESDKLLNKSELNIELTKAGWLNTSLRVKKGARKKLQTSNTKLQTLNCKLVFSSKHLLTHQTIYANFWLISEGFHSPKLQEDFLKIKLIDLEKYPIHRLFDKFMQYYLQTGK